VIVQLHTSTKKTKIFLPPIGYEPALHP